VTGCGISRVEENGGRGAVGEDPGRPECPDDTEAALEAARGRKSAFKGGRERRGESLVGGGVPLVAIGRGAGGRVAL
jgi:hypothetical protein